MYDMDNLGYCLACKNKLPWNPDRVLAHQKNLDGDVITWKCTYRGDSYDDDSDKGGFSDTSDDKDEC
jgi:hypothetical protein